MKTLHLFFSLCISLAVLAQPASELQYAAYLKSSHSLWQQSVTEAEQQFGTMSFERALALYGLLNNTMASEDEQTFDAFKEETIDILKHLLEKNPEHAEAHAVLSATYGLVMAYSPMKGMFLGSKSSSLMERAAKLNPESALVQKLYAGWKLHTPSMFGGDDQEAIKAFERSVALFELGDTTNNWMYADALVWLALAYQRTDNETGSRTTLKKAVSFEPDFGWAKSLLAKMDKS